MPHRSCVKLDHFFLFSNISSTPPRQSSFPRPVRVEYALATRRRHHVEVGSDDAWPESRVSRHADSWSQGDSAVAMAPFHHLPEAGGFDDWQASVQAGRPRRRQRQRHQMQQRQRPLAKRRRRQVQRMDTVNWQQLELVVRVVRLYDMVIKASLTNAHFLAECDPDRIMSERSSPTPITGPSKSH
ncbi:unnamed protein product [Protopolystoma xenopodis]|uniref:Uncharacterized protein n=1 Tax=Protopolystoma xenopodis TaxID=117903 RepID=A0A3S5AZW8_9PLAT|nr:unnamed protein product [Protopolystoma xenopodis]